MGLVIMQAVCAVKLSLEVVGAIIFSAVESTVERSAIVESRVVVLGLVEVLGALFKVLEFFLVFGVDGEDHSLFALTLGFATKWLVKK